MTSPVERITVECPDCRHVYEDWYRASINLALDDFDDDYLERASTTTCPSCGAKYAFGTLFARRDDDGSMTIET